jgi:AcrR family transcriptional regulator
VKPVAVRYRIEPDSTAVPARRSERPGEHVAAMQRRRLLLASVEVLAESGYAEASMGRICARAGVSRRTFYDLFNDREDCLLAMFDDLVERIVADVRPALGSGGCWRERIRAALTALLDLFDREPDVARVCLVETARAGPVMLERRRAVFERLVAAVDEGRRDARAGSAPASLTAESVVGGALAVVQERVLQSSAAGNRTLGREADPLVALVNPLMSMIVNPYLGPAAARRELELPAPVTVFSPRAEPPASVRDPFAGLPVRITFRTARVLGAIAAVPGANNRAVGEVAGVADQGQMSKLLKRLEAYGLIENRCSGLARGEPNAWWLTTRGDAIQRALHAPAA